MCNFKFESTFSFDLDAKSSNGKSCLSPCNWFGCICRQRHQGNKESHKTLSKNFNSALLTLTESLNAYLYVFISPPLHGWHSSSNHYTKTNNQQSFLSPDKGLTLEKSALLFLHIESLTLTLFQTWPKIRYTISDLTLKINTLFQTFLIVSSLSSSDQC